MKGFFYTKTDEIKNNLQIIDNLRINFSLKPINPQKKYFLQWETLNKRIEIINNFYNEKYHIKNNLKNLFNYLYYNFYGKNQLLTSEELIDFFLKYLNSKLIININQFNEALKYIQISNEHPIIQGCLSKIIFFDLNPFLKFNEIFSDVIQTIFFYQNGYDFERIVPFEEIYLSNNFNKIFKLAIETENLTPWIDFFISQLIILLENTLKDIDNKKTENYSFLNDRQKQILFLFNEPNIKITNKFIMRKFKIAPVTAARDLAKLVKYNLIISVGKGRSTYYIKI